MPFKSKDEGLQILIDEYNQYFNNYSNSSEFVFINLKKSLVVEIENNEIRFSNSENIIISETIWRTIKTFS